MPDPTLLERADQQEILVRTARDARHGAGGVLVIEGPAGIGKSRLLAELRSCVGPQQRLLSARASELERDFAFGVARQLLEGIYRDEELGPVATEGPAAAVAGVFDDAAGGTEAASFGLLHALHWMVLNLAEQGPLVLAIDDLHWCDSSSLRFLVYLARRLEGTDILLVVATRPVPPSNPEVSMHVELVGDPTAVHVHPLALSRGATTRLLAEQLDAEVDDEFAAACFEATDGNPLMLRQLARSLAAEGTVPRAAHAGEVRRSAHRALSRTVLARVGRSSPVAIDVARAVAVLGEPSLPEVAAMLGDRDELAVEAAWLELAELEILRRESLAYVHALVRDAVYHDLPVAQRARMHARAARALESAGASVERVASQLSHVPPSGDAWAAEVSIAAGEAALRRGAPDAAVVHLRRALAEPAPEELRLPTTRTLARALFDVDAAGAITVTAELAELEPDPVDQVGTKLATIQARALNDDWQGGSDLARATLASLPPEAEHLRPVLEGMRAIVALFGADDPEGLDAMREHYRADPGRGVPERLRAGMAAFRWMLDGGSADECAELALAAASDDPEMFRDHIMIAVAPLYVLALADRAEVIDRWQMALRHGHEHGSLLLAVAVNLWMGMAHQRLGDNTAAVPALELAIRRMADWGLGEQAERLPRASLSLAYLDRGDLVRARAALGSGVHAIPADATFAQLWWLQALAWLQIHEGDPEGSVATCDLLEQRAAWVTTPVGFDWRRPRCIALHRLGRQDEALRDADALVATSERWGSPGVLGPALRARGEINGQAGIDDLRRSVAVLDGSAAKLELTRSLLLLGTMLRRAGQVAEAREHLLRARDQAEERGAPALALVASDELEASGLRSRRLDPAGPGTLTPSERRVAELASVGRTNREIAQELFVTPKTVEVHLSATYRKLGIEGRRGLAAALQPA